MSNAMFDAFEQSIHFFLSVFAIVFAGILAALIVLVIFCVLPFVYAYEGYLTLFKR